MSEVIYEDGSISTFHEGGSAFHDGRLAIDRLRLITAIQALRINLKGEGWELTRNGSKLAVVNVIEPMSGMDFHTPTGRLTSKGRRKALKVAEQMLAAIESGAVIYEED